jgi:hypothetical protein
MRRLSRIRSIWWIPARNISTAPPTSPARCSSASQATSRSAPTRWCSRAISRWPPRAFPKGTTGAHLDALARQFLWAHGLDYAHGTGHGVGSYLGVHEGQARIAKQGLVPLEPGMLLSNEPGYYKEGAFGIRLENLVFVTEPEDVGGDQPMMGFETITRAPFERRLIDWI